MSCFTTQPNNQLRPRLSLDIRLVVGKPFVITGNARFDLFQQIFPVIPLFQQDVTTEISVNALLPSLLVSLFRRVGNPNIGKRLGSKTGHLLHHAANAERHKLKLQLSSYRLLGYDVKHISAEDFDDPEKDTGEIGSNLCVTVLYELELNEAETEGSLAEVAVRWQDAQSENAEAVLTVTGEEGDNEDVRFAACVAEFALVLRRSQYAGSASIANVLARLNELRAGFADDVYKTEFVQIVSLAEESGFYGAQEQENEAR